MMKDWNGLCAVGGIAIRFDLHQTPRPWAAFKRAIMAGPVDTNEAELSRHESKMRASGMSYCYTFHIVPPLAKRGIIRLVLRPEGYAEPAPITRTRYDSIADAQRAALADAANPARIVRITNTAPEAGGPCVEVWDAGEYARRNGELFTAAELEAARCIYQHDAVFYHVVRPARGRERGTAGTKARGQTTREKIRTAFTKLRDSRPNTPAPMLREILAGKQPAGVGKDGKPRFMKRRKGFSRANIYKHTADLK